MTAEIIDIPTAIRFREIDQRNSKEIYESLGFAIHNIGAEIEALFSRPTQELMAYKFVDELGRTQGITCMLAQWIKHLEFAKRSLDARRRVTL